jgi:hypothetical protein
LCCLFALSPLNLVWAQSAANNVTGTVTDATGAVVANAAVELKSTRTNATLTTQTDSGGQYIFAAVEPGPYAVTISKQGFAKFVAHFDVAIGRGAMVNVRLELGAVSQTVEVTAGSAVELQTLDASVGNVINQDALDKLPSLSRDATAILLMQPMAAPGFNSAEGNGTGGQVAGARSDQNTFLLDGGDATSNTEGGGGYANQAGSGFSAEARASVPTPVESLEEFRVTTNNSNLFARSAGGSVEMVTRRGTNNWHGAAYEYNQNTVYNANTWQLNNEGLPRGVWQDNRFGARMGGPIWKDKAYFFTMYEGRRFKKANQVSRRVPSALLKQGILQFKDSTGAVVPYNLATSTACGPVDATHPIGGGLPCDPRGLGLSPVISQIWGFEPDGNNSSEGDGLNRLGYDFAVPVITHENFAVTRLDYKINQKWDFNSSFRYSVSDGTGSGQVDIGGIVPGDTKGVPVATRKLPTQPRFFVAGLTGRLTNQITNDFHYNFLRHWWAWTPVSPFPQVSGLGAAVQIFAESATNGLVPMNIDTQNARSRSWNGRDHTFNDYVTWIKGKHLIQFGGEFRREHFFHARDDKVVGALTSPVYFATKSSDNTIPAANRPPTCDTAAGISTNCLLSTDLANWNNLYAATTGMISRASQLLTRDSSFNPNPPGIPNLQDSIVHWYDLHFADSWRMTPSFTLTYGFGWGYQSPPYETKGRQTIMIYTATGKEVHIGDYLAQRAAAAEQGQMFNPEVGFAPIRTTGRKYPYNPDFSNIEPRLSLAWNPSFSGGVLGSFFGNRKAVIRAGYGRYSDRLNGVGLVMTPALGIGYGNTVNCRGPRIGGGCARGANPTNSFRIGVDGNTVALPSLTTITPPLIPGNNSPYETLDFRIDPKRRVGMEDTWDLSIQREMPSKMLLEVGYVGRVAHHLYGANDLNQIPYMFKAGGQTFADAYDTVTSALRAGTAPSLIAVQPWYEAMLSGSGACVGYTSCTDFIASTDAGNMLNGFVTDHWEGMVFNGALNKSLFPPGLDSTVPLDTQFLIEQISTSEGNSNYQAGYISLRKQPTHGVSWQVNYTLSRSNDNLGVNQENVFISPTDGFNKNRDYGPSAFDRRHVLNAFFIYDLPFGRGHRLSGANLLNRVIGGWTVTGQFVAASGLPLRVINDVNTCGEELGNGYADFCAALIPLGGKLKSSGYNGSNGNVFGVANPASLFRPMLFSDRRSGFGSVRGFNRWNMDAALTKTIDITERVKMRFDAQAVNVFNHMQFVDPDTDIAVPSTFGVVTTEYGPPRFLNLGLRIVF